MFISKTHGTIEITGENARITWLLAVFVGVFTIFLATVIFLIFKIVYKKVEAKYFRHFEKNLSDAGIRPISHFIPKHMDKRLEELYNQQRGSLPVEASKRATTKSPYVHFE